MNHEIQQYVADGARRITPRHLEKLVRWLPEIRLLATQIIEFPRVPDQVELLAELVEDFQAGLNREIPYTAVAEAAFALLYLRRSVDIIPDMIPGIGRADDAAIIAAVLENYKQPFLKHVIAKGVHRPIEEV